jgi:hypothetical protein
MRLLIANPDTDQFATDRIAAVAHAAASPGTEIRAASFGAPYIATRAEAVLGAAAGSPASPSIWNVSATARRS